MVSVDVVSVNWNSGIQLRECLGSLCKLEESRRLLKSVVVVDNASTDGSADNLRGLDVAIEVVRNKVNRGFAAACNEGARLGSAEALLFLNPDTRLFSGSLEVPARFLAERATVGLCGIQLVNEGSDVWRSCARIPSAAQLVAKAIGLDRLSVCGYRGYPMVEWDHGSDRRVDHVIGAFYFVRRSAFEALGGFDESFFLYLEDLDLSLRLKRAGWETWYLTSARAFHKGGGTSEAIRGLRLFYSLRSRLEYARKNLSAGGCLAAAGATLLVEPVVRCAWSLGRGATGEVRETLEAYRELWKYSARTAWWQRSS